MIPDDARRCQTTKPDETGYIYYIYNNDATQDLQSMMMDLGTAVTIEQEQNPKVHKPVYLIAVSPSIKDEDD